MWTPYPPCRKSNSRLRSQFSEQRPRHLGVKRRGRERDSKLTHGCRRIGPEILKNQRTRIIFEAFCQSLLHHVCIGFVADAASSKERKQKTPSMLFRGVMSNKLSLTVIWQRSKVLLICTQLRKSAPTNLSHLGWEIATMIVGMKCYLGLAMRRVILAFLRTYLYPTLIS